MSRDPLLVLLWVALSYGWTLSFGLSNDDFIWIYASDLSATESPIRHALASPVGAGNFFRPLVQLTFIANYATAGLRPFGYHLVNVVLHALNALLVWRLAQRVIGGRGAALAAALVFSVHPAGAEAVAWVSGRTELLCAALYLAALHFHLRGRVRVGLAFFGLALCAKETAVTLPLVVAAAELFLRAKGERRLSRVVPYLAVLGVYLGVRAAVVRTFAVGIIESDRVFSLDLDALVRLARVNTTLLGELLLEPVPLHGFLRSAIILAAIVGGGALWSTRTSPVAGRAIRFSLAMSLLALLPYALWPWLRSWHVYLATAGTSIFLAATAGDAARLIPSTRRTAAVGVALALWLGTSVLRVQIANDHERRAGLVTGEILEALVEAAPSAAPYSVFVLSGLSSYRVGTHPRAGKPVVAFGLREALRLRHANRTMDVEFAGAFSRRRGRNTAAADRRPRIHLDWDEASKRFRRLPDPGP